MKLGRLISSSIVFLLAMDVGGSAFAQYNRSIILAYPVNAHDRYM